MWGKVGPHHGVTKKYVRRPVETILVPMLLTVVRSAFFRPPNTMHSTFGHDPCEQLFGYFQICGAMTNKIHVQVCATATDALRVRTWRGAGSLFEQRGGEGFRQRRVASRGSFSGRDVCQQLGEVAGGAV